MVANPSGNGVPHMAMLGRTLPHSIEAEEYVLSCCMLEESGAETLARCHIAGLKPVHMYDTKHGMVLDVLYRLYNDGEATTPDRVALEMERRGELQQVGGVPFLMQVSKLVPTSAQAGPFIAKVRDDAVRRNAIRVCSSLVERSYNSGDVTELLEDVRTSVTAIPIGDAPQSFCPLIEHNLADTMDTNTIFGTDRYICRGDTCMIVSTSGMGKSVLNYQWAWMAALGWPFLGIATARPMKSIIFQSEDSAGDIAEVVASLRHKYPLTPAQEKLLAENVIVITDRVSRGPAFLARLKAAVDRFKPDLVWINPLHAYAGCDLAKAEEAGVFLREGLNKVNKDGVFAYMMIHHTPKPPAKKEERKWNEGMYGGAGSAELTNFCRSIIVLEATDTPGEFNLQLHKRGSRAGIVVSAPGNGEGVTQLISTTVIPCKHASEYIKVPGYSRQLKAMYWVGRDADPAKVVVKKEKPAPQTQYTLDDIIPAIPVPDEGARSYGAVRKALNATNADMSKSSFIRLINEAVGKGYVKKVPREGYILTDRGVQEKDDIARRTP